MARPPSDDPKTKVVATRFTVTEHVALLRDAARSGVSVSQFVRAKALAKDGACVTVKENRHYEPLDPELFRELRRQGVNLNQIARQCNRNGAPPGPDFFKLQGKLQAILEKISTRP
jgi:hypothetical protein